MFNFFSKKEYLVDHLNGFIDIHNHILPGIDDGAEEVEESIEMLKAFAEFGVTRFICTPHIMHNYYDNTPKIIEKSFKKLKKSIKKEGLSRINIRFAAEHMIDDNFERILKNNKTLPLNSTHLLVEMSYLQPSINFDSAIKKIYKHQLFPVFAHPERYLYLHNNYQKTYKDLKSKGILFQLNMLSLGGYYGSDIQAIAFKLLDKNMYEFIASDVHNIKHLNAMKKITLSRSKIDKVLVLVNRTIDTFL